ncbi:PREDICTED: exonuclease 1 isoform X2 [Vollenhovia emeryi]|uniref:exonuclease 1 isoform X2 n=1 Tax=Vollenhovia emeryi TaxID=411798 RepID=UPI0005F3CB02|nr:PREDICTED: exonuclease 1 isoform X2 [Vollenhovia emeryi]
MVAVVYGPMKRSRWLLSRYVYTSCILETCVMFASWRLWRQCNECLYGIYVILSDTVPFICYKLRRRLIHINMGITGLLPFLEKSSRKTNIKEFSGGTVAIDTYCWLHKGVFSCAEKLMMGQTTNAYILYCMKYINMLLKYKIKPILVFDGRRLPAKEQTEIKRREARQTNRRKAIELIQMGQVAEGTNLLRRAIDITYEIALELIKHCQKENIDCITAPYEADAQLAYLNINGIADVVITEDSDLTLFGCKKIFFKMDFNGNGVLIEQDRLYLAMDMKPEQFDMEKFRYICILSGCDYLPSLPGIGLGKARKFITRNTDRNIHRALTRIASILNMKSLVVTQEYRDAFILADITFKHQLVFCPLQRKQVRLNRPPVDVTEDQLLYAGKELDMDVALQLALGNCDPVTLKMVHNFNPDKIERKRKRDAEIEQTVIQTSIWSSRYKLKTKYQITSSEGVLNSSDIVEKEFSRERKSLKDANVLLNLYNGSLMQSNNLLKDEDFNKTAILDMYNSNQDAKLTASPKNFPESSEDYLCFARNNTSPELLRQRNPFVKRVSDFTTSPSVLSNGNCRKRGRNLMRIKRTIIDDNAIIESKYFSKEDNKQHIVVATESKNKEIEVDTKSTKHNTIPNMKASMCNSIEYDINQEEEKPSIIDIAQNTSLVENINAKVLSNQTDCLTDTKNVPEKSNPNKINDVLSMKHESYISDDFLVSSSSNMKANDMIDYKNVNSSQSNLFKWSNTENNRISYKRNTNKRQSSSNLVLRVNSVTKRKQLSQSKQLSPSPKQQSLLSMYGFQKRASLKH